ncbi:MAG: hypothetical protein IM537_18750 [Pseudanabaena sp. M57BS1SP1A06MG]|nr:hypothetical protein [Pseudanabaena sp. M34BS1SP1A06MG]MCA6602189.1 hypothetical protein [Pseudanabaena sp. M57BS1SP1A06MG]
MQVLEKMTTAEELTQAQLNAVKERAIELWGDNWKMQLAYKYAEVVGVGKREKTTLVRRWFDGESSPNLDSFNNLLLAVGCKISISCTEIKQIL